MKKGLVSVVIPVYNGGQWIKRCLESVLNQSYNKIEIIIVDDGSTDDSTDIINNYAKIDDRINVIKKKNSGVSDTRNVGIKKASGEFMVFVDCDDYIDSGHIRKLVGLMKNDTDFGVVGWLREDEAGNIIKKCIRINGTFDSKKCIRNLVSMKGINGYSVSKIFRTEIIKKNRILFDKKITLFEDLIFCCLYAKHCKTIRIDTRECYYHYVVNKSGAIYSAINNNDFDEKWLSEIKALKMVALLIKENTVARNIVRSRIALSSVFYLNRMIDCGYINSEIKGELIANIRKNFLFVLLSFEGNIKWRLKTVLFAISPGIMCFIVSKRKK